MLYVIKKEKLLEYLSDDEIYEMTYKIKKIKDDKNILNEYNY